MRLPLGDERIGYRTGYIQCDSEESHPAHPTGRKSPVGEEGEDKEYQAGIKGVRDEQAGIEDVREWGRNLLKSSQGHILNAEYFCHEPQRKNQNHPVA